MPDFDSGVAWLPPLAIAAAIVGAALIMVAGNHVPRKVATSAAAAVAAVVTALDGAVLSATASGRVVTWSAGWQPHHGFSVGIVLVSDLVGSGAALVAGALTTLALLYSTAYMERVGAHYRSLMLLFLAGMTGFAFTGDLFDMFVFFELMGASAYALTGLKVEDPTAVQGGFNFGVVNSLGAYVSLMGLGMLYSRTGNLGLPQLHQDLSGHRPDALVVTAFALVLTGFLVKGSVVPFHFWLADAHAVAPPPVCVLFSGIMVPLGVYAVFRVYWVVFSGTLPAGEVRPMLLVLGTATAALGATMCLAQRHIKRLLAYSTIAHVGLFICALALLDRDGTAGALLYAAGHAGVKAALFLLAGLLLAHYGSVDEHDLYGQGSRRGIEPWLWLAGGLALAGLPPFGTALGKAVAEEAAIERGQVWLVPIFILVSAATGGAVLRVTARVFFGLGPVPSENAGQSSTHGDEEREDVIAGLPVTMAVPIFVLLLGGLAVGSVPGARAAATHAAAFFTEPRGYARAALYGVRALPSAGRQANWTALGLGFGFLSTVLAVILAVAGLYTRNLLEAAGVLGRAGAAVLSGLRRLHSGHIGDYVTWLLAGTGAVFIMVALPASR
ncbi:MAG: complex I subunit 5 family protein [Acidimicrobiales bacterium]